MYCKPIYLCYWNWYLWSWRYCHKQRTGGITGSFPRMGVAYFKNMWTLVPEQGCKEYIYVLHWKAHWNNLISMTHSANLYSKIQWKIADGFRCSDSVFVNSSCAASISCLLSFISGKEIWDWPVLRSRPTELHKNYPSEINNGTLLSETWK